MYIDIHNHSLFGVDDGPADIETSLRILMNAKALGAEAVILTPHRRYGMFECPRDVIDSHFEQLVRSLDGEGPELYIGSEYHMCLDAADDFRNGAVHSLADTEYVLTEYSHMSSFTDMVRYTDMMQRSGFIPIIAHAERYECLWEDVDMISELKSHGALIQLNAGSVLGFEGRKLERVCRRVLKNGAADLIAGDVHDMRDRCDHMAECREHISRKYSREYAESLFVGVPRKVIGK